jgi:hypothetical protein
MTRQPSKQENLATVRCTDGRWFQVRKDFPALSANSTPLQPAEWEVRNELAKLHLATATLESAPVLAKLVRLARYRQAKIIHDHATRRFQEVARRSPHHHQAAEQLAKAIKDDQKRPAHAR